MADIDARGRGDVKESVQPSESFVRLPSGEHPHSIRNDYGEFSHTLFDTNYDHSPYASFNAGGASSGSGSDIVEAKYVHPFMMERYVDATGEDRLRMYSGNLYCTLSTIVFRNTEIPDTSTGSGNIYLIHMKSQPRIAGATKKTVAGFSNIEDPNGNPTVLSKKEFPAEESYGKYYLKWGVTVSAGVVADDWNRDTDLITWDSIGIHWVDPFDDDPVDDPIGELAIDGNDDEQELKRADRTGTYYVKIGTSYNPLDEAGSRVIHQDLFDHVYWAPTIVSETHT
jgi:hypothetical protein